MSDEAALRPKDLALLLLASGDALPRQRARDQQADIAGLELKRRLLVEIMALDPEPEALEAALSQLVEQFGPPTGPTRSIAGSLLDDWHAATQGPEFVEWLLAQALAESERPERRAQGAKRRT